MRHGMAYTVLVALAGMLLLTGGAPQPSRPDVQGRVEELLRRMTIEEKIGQMTQVAIGVVLEEKEGVKIPGVIDPTKLDEALQKYHVGSILNVESHAPTLKEWQTIITTIQDHGKKTRLGIPVLYGIDAIHGANYTMGGTIFPQHLGMASTWNPALVEREGEITAIETRASGIPWNFNPVLDIGRHPAWPRLFETFGEDVYLASVMGRSYVRGLQGDDMGAPDRIAACMKHYVGYSFPLSGKDRTQAWIPERIMREYFLPPFEAAVEAGAMTVMVNSSENNGIPAHSDDFLLKKVLRGDLGFKGFVVSDWEDIKRLHSRDRVADSPKEAVRLAVMAGVDMSMVPMDYSFYELLLELVREGSVPEQRIDEAVARILTVKFMLGLFENPYPDPSVVARFASPDFKEVSLDAARQSIVLLKNKKNVLPLPKDMKILVTGPTAHSRAAMNSGWTITWQGDREDLYPTTDPTIVEALKNTWGDANVQYLPGTTFDTPIDIPAVVKAFAKSDVAVVCLGERAYCESPGNINDLSLEEAQLSLVKSLVATGKPVVLVLVEGRPRIFRQIEEGVDAVLAAFLPGVEGGRAIADILSGAVNPSGKLPVTYPRYPNALMTYDHKPIDVADVNEWNPQYPFGFGLSYTTFEYSDLKLVSVESTPEPAVKISVRVKNTGGREGMEVVQLYLTDIYGSVSRPVKQLKRFAKISLAPGQAHEVAFELNKQDFMFVGRGNTWIYETGNFRVSVDKLAEDFTLR